ncbi:wax ester/triacylglycerol synthase domain-containing protein [Nocardia sp. NPDC127579]|uniref:wax ester/triacylglycerol synthase domain-containing protein n=1 Tax=Nocardia sp. NPDC127579 TaxID=3345402 RepID=UPI003633499E
MKHRRRMAPQDATMYWLSARTRNDLFLLYAFADRGVPTAVLRERIQQRSTEIPDLTVRVRTVPRDLDYPSWEPCGFRTDQVVEHSARDWAQIHDVVGELLGTGVNAADRPWRLHLFRGVADVPGAPGLATVAVLQMSHALADGTRAAAIARALFAPESPGGRPESARPVGGENARLVAVENARPVGGENARPVGGENARPVGVESARLVAVENARLVGGGNTRPVAVGMARPVAVELGRRGVFGMVRRVAGEVPLGDVLELVGGVLRMPGQVLRTVVRGLRAFRAQQALAELTAVGELPGPGPSYRPSAVNPAGAVDDSAHRVRMLVRDSAELKVPGRTVTVVVLTAVSIALTEYLHRLGTPVNESGAQVPMAMPGDAATRNNYRSLGVDLCLDEPDLRRRADKITRALAERRARAVHPLLCAQDRVTDVTPAALLHRDLDRYPLDSVPAAIAGHTVVSSVHRGPADLTFGGPALFTAGFPAVGSVMHLTHGVHGLGATVTISIHADSRVIPDIDAYTHLLDAALRTVVTGRASR